MLQYNLAFVTLLNRISAPNRGSDIQNGVGIWIAGPVISGVAGLATEYSYRDLPLYSAADTTPETRCAMHEKARTKCTKLVAQLYLGYPTKSIHNHKSQELEPKSPERGQ